MFFKQNYNVLEKTVRKYLKKPFFFYFITITQILLCKREIVFSTDVNRCFSSLQIFWRAFLTTFAFEYSSIKQKNCDFNTYVCIYLSKHPQYYVRCQCKFSVMTKIRLTDFYILCLRQCFALRVCLKMCISDSSIFFSFEFYRLNFS